MYYDVIICTYDNGILLRWMANATLFHFSLCERAHWATNGSNFFVKTYTTKFMVVWFIGMFSRNLYERL